MTLSLFYWISVVLYLGFEVWRAKSRIRQLEDELSRIQFLILKSIEEYNKEYNQDNYK